MTRKDYVLLAQALKQCKTDFSNRNLDHDAQHKADCNYIAAALAAENPRFDRARFLKACGIEA